MLVFKSIITYWQGSDPLVSDSPCCVLRLSCCLKEDFSLQ
jgi:hypothetical protein